MLSDRLLCVTGLSPQVVTETLYALWRDGGQTPDALPREVHVVTTAEGRERVRLGLFDDPARGGLGQFRRFCDDFGIPPGHVRLDESTVHVIHDPQGHALHDITTRDHNHAAADELTTRIRGLCQDAAPLHVSLAGGRKTMGFFAGYALSLFGRPQDRLSHVLVNSPFESHPDFYYPPPKPRTLLLRDGKQMASTAAAQVELADIPFVRLYEGRPAHLLNGKMTYAETVQAAQAALGPAQLSLDLDDARVSAGQTNVPLAPADFAFLAWFARRAKEGAPALPRPPDGYSQEYARDYLAHYGRHQSLGHATLTRYRLGMSLRDFDERKSRVNKAFEAALGPAAAPYLITGDGSPKRFAIRLPPHQIHLHAYAAPHRPDEDAQ